VDASAPNSVLQLGSASPSHLELLLPPRYGTPEAAGDSPLSEAGPPFGVHAEPLPALLLGPFGEEGFAIDDLASFRTLFPWL